MTLQYRSSDGALLYHASGGALMAACCCVDCNDCDPALTVTYTVTISGLTGSLASWNGAYTVTFRPGYTCVWRWADESGHYIDLYWDNSGIDGWRIEGQFTSDDITWQGSHTDCTITGTYTYDHCHGTCTDVSGSSAVVS